MENLAKHIEYLILRHDCVVVPGIGAFINMHKAPFFDNETGLLRPASCEIIFNSALRSDDGLLANSIARKLRIEFRQGAEILRNCVNCLNNTLDIDGEVTIGRIGILRKENEGNLRFLPFKSAEQYAAEEGWKAVRFGGRTHKEILSASTEVGCNDKSGDRICNEEYISQDICETGSQGFGDMESDQLGNSDKYAERRRSLDFNRNYYIPVNKVAFKSAVCLVIILAFAIMSLILPERISDRNIDRASVVPVGKLMDTARQVAGLDTGSVRLVESPHEESSEIKAEEPANEEKYYLIVATFASAEDAENFKNANIHDEYNLEIVHSRKMYRVSAKSSCDKNLLIDVMTSDTFRSQFDQAWIWKNK